jgi:sugar (pentulose or hexulose) kinase
VWRSSQVSASGCTGTNGKPSIASPGPTFEPDSAHAALYAEWFQIYKELYPALRPISHKLSDGPKAQKGT